jgi:hypothetical protein
MKEQAIDREGTSDNPKEPVAKLSLQDVAHSTLFDYEVRGKPPRYNAFYDFVKAYPNIFEQAWQTTPEIDGCIARLASVDCSEDDPDYAVYVQGIRYNMTDAFYTANRPIMDVICLAYRLFVKVKELQKGA